MPSTKAPKGLDIGRLCTAMHRARLVLEKPRWTRVEFTRQYVGAHYSIEGARLPVPVNLLASYISIVGRKLIANNPRVMLSTFEHQYTRTVETMEDWANKEIEKIGFAESLKRWVVDSLFSVGFMKVALASPYDAALSAWAVQAGDPYAQNIDLDDMVWDVFARKFSECGFIGHRVRVPLMAIKDSGMFGRGRKAAIEGTENMMYNLEGDERIGMLSRTTLAGAREEYEDFVDLWEVYVPRHKVVVTLLNDQLLGAAMGADQAWKHGIPHGRALNIQPWLGPQWGPIIPLGMSTVPGNALPKAPLQDLYDLHMFINRCTRKLMRQTDRQKEVLFCPAASGDDGKRAIDASDGEAWNMANPKDMMKVNFGGPDQRVFELMNAFKEVFSWLSGNLEIMGGLGAQSKTATQDELLNQNASASISEMQDSVGTGVARAIKSMCWFWHHNPSKYMKSKFTLPGLPQVSTVRRVGPQERQQIAFEDLDIRVDPCSMVHMTPQMRGAALDQLVMQIVAPLMPIMQQQGVIFDMQAFLQKRAKYFDMPDLPEIVGVSNVPVESTQQSAQGNSEGAGMPATTTRNYNRRSTGGDTSANRMKEAGDGMAQATAAINGQEAA